MKTAQLARYSLYSAPPVGSTAVLEYHHQPDSGDVLQRVHVAVTPTDPSTEYADVELMRRIAQRDRAAFETFYHRYAPRLGRFLSRVLKQNHLVEEAVNDTLLTVWQSADRYDPQLGRLSTWLFGIAHNKGIKTLTRHTRHSGQGTQEYTDDHAWDDTSTDSEMHESVEWADPETTVSGWQLGDALATALEQLSPEHRAVIELTFMEKFSYKEIAAVMNCPLNTVKTRMFHARKQLADLLAKSGHLTPLQKSNSDE